MKDYLVVNIVCKKHRVSWKQEGYTFFITLPHPVRNSFLHHNHHHTEEERKCNTKLSSCSFDSLYPVKNPKIRFLPSNKISRVIKRPLDASSASFFLS